MRQRIQWGRWEVASAPHSRSNFFHFHAVFGTNLAAPSPVWQILDTPLLNVCEQTAEIKDLPAWEQKLFPSFAGYHVTVPVRSKYLSLQIDAARARIIK